MSKRRRHHVKRKKKYLKANKIYFYFIFFFLSISVSLILYTLFLFPKTLNKNIKKDLVSLYKPVLTEDSENLFIIKVKNQPDLFLQKEIYHNFKIKYGLELYYETVKSDDLQDIKRICFLKNNKEGFTGINDYYIFWDNISNEKQYDVNEKNKIKNEIITLSKKENYEKIEDKRRAEKKEILIKPKQNDFKKVIKSDTDYSKKTAKIIIIIDDLGYSYNSTYSFLTLGFPITFAVIPGLNDSKKFYNLFNSYGYELILHIPMEPEKGKKYVESNAIFSEMQNNEVQAQLRHFFDEYPNVIGANNHMGSKIISDQRIMGILLKEIKNNDKIWLDSKTGLNDVSKESASENNVKFFERDVFLDNSKDPVEIRNAMNKLIKEAKKKGYALGIGHIQTKELVPVLKEYFSKKSELGVEFVPLSSLKK